MVNLRTLCYEEVANILPAEECCEEQRRLALFGCKLHFGVFADQALHGSKVPLCRRPHQRGLVLVIHLVHLRALFDEELAHLPMPIRSCFHQRVFGLFCAIVRRHAMCFHKQIANVQVSRQGCPHERIPTLVVLQVERGALFQQNPYDLGLSRLTSLHQAGDALVVLRIENTFLLGRDGLRGVSSASEWPSLFSLRDLRLDQIVNDVQQAVLTCLH
mmetsp:Transcript_39279/g.108284  ORF Transcript_39279/g.108284 Transcript_39279/m.108284 type:complete len:216 (-) Transcript_39279:361-1008(-)